MNNFHVFLAFLLLISITPVISVDAASNPNLFVSAENSQFGNRFSGSMVIEVVIRNPNISDTGEGKGEPDVTINGKTLRMVQATDGNWYAYFAHVDKAKAADSTVGLAGKGLDFGVFCSRNTPSSVVGISLSETDGFSIPRSSGLTGGSFTNGNSSFLECAGNPTSSTSLNNVVRHAKSINTNSNVLSGQIGLDQDAWPLIQLYSFDDVTIQYNAGGNPQSVSLDYDESQNISINLDRDMYPQNSEVFLTVKDFQLNQDPTDEDSWTFGIDSGSTFYQAFDSAGSNSANGGAGLVNLISSLSSLGFEDNGKLFLNLGSILELTSNSEQPSTSVSNGVTTFSKIVTLVENGPNSGLFDSIDDNDNSVVKILSDAPRGQTGNVNYNQKSVSVLTGFSSASVSIKPAITFGSGSTQLAPGTKYPVTLIDPDQNINSGSREHLDVFRDSANIPSLQTGKPITLEKSSDLQFFQPSSTLGNDAQSFVSDTNSDILFVDTSNLTINSFQKISLKLGVSASTLHSSLIDSSILGVIGTNWLNYDFRSFEKDLELTDFSKTSIQLSFGTLGNSPITIVDSGDLSSSKGFVQLDDSDIQALYSKSGDVFVTIDFDSTGKISNESNKQPVVLDFFSFGIKNENAVNNAIYRFELEETSDNSSKFVGSLEYAVTNQLNILDSNFIKTIRTIDNEIKLIVINRLIDEQGVSISYSDLDPVGVFITTAKSDIFTHSGIVSTGSSSYRFGQPVTLTLNDPDLNLNNDLVEIYFVIDDPNSSYVDTVGKDGNILLEVLIKDVRYKRCTINGVEYGGLAATGFTLVETGPKTGIFSGVFKMPSKICDKSGTKLISTAGGSLDAKYHDSRDDFGNSNIITMSRSKSTSSFSTLPTLSTTNVSKPLSQETEEIILSGSVSNHKRGVPLTIILIGPDGRTQNFAANLSSSGSYKTVFTVNENSLSGVYKIQLIHDGVNLGSQSFTVSNPKIPELVKNNAKLWSSSTISNSKFVDSIEQLIEKGLILLPSGSSSNSDRVVPDWVKNNAKWWSNNQISDEDFIKSIQYLVKKGIIRV